MTSSCTAQGEKQSFVLLYPGRRPRVLQAQEEFLAAKFEGGKNGVKKKLVCVLIGEKTYMALLSRDLTTRWGPCLELSCLRAPAEGPRALLAADFCPDALTRGVAARRVSGCSCLSC